MPPVQARVAQHAAATSCQRFEDLAFVLNSMPSLKSKERNEVDALSTCAVSQSSP